MVSLDKLRTRLVRIEPDSAVLIEDAAPAWVIYTDKQIGVAIPCDTVFPEGLWMQFSEIEVKYYPDLLINNVKHAVLFLYVEHDKVSNDELREFACICADFIDRGIYEENRKRIVSNPVKWWENMKHIMGNRSVTEQIYSVVGELIIYDYLLLQHATGIVWTGNSRKRVDFTTDQRTYEVKTTLQRYGSTITVHGQFQLSGSKDTMPQRLEFCRLEESSSHGISADNLLSRLEEHGADITSVLKSLNSLGFPAGSPERQKKFDILEIREYIIDDNFPAITPQSFVDGKIPDGIVRLDYQVDLENLPYTPVNYAI